MQSSAAWWPTLALVVTATVTDLRSRRIPNWLVLPFLAAGLAFSAWRHGWSGLGHSAAGLLLGAILFGILSWMGGMGMGDVKLCAAIGAWVGPAQLLVALVLAGIAGGVIALCWAVAGGFLGELFEGAGQIVRKIWERGPRLDAGVHLDDACRRRMPYAPAIAIGTLISFFAH